MEDLSLNNDLMISETDLDELFSSLESGDDDDADYSKCELDIEPVREIIEPKPRRLSEIDRTLSTVEDLKVLLNTIGIYRKNGFQILFRGHAKESFVLQPSIVRSGGKGYTQEKYVLEKVKDICKSMGYERFKASSFNENFFYMSIGRHLGLNSRLLDWTAGLREALAFLIEDKDDYMEHDGCLWLVVYDQNKYQVEKDKDPFQIDDDKLHILKEDYIQPEGETSFSLGIDRRYKQHGFFTVQAEAILDVPFEELAKASDFELYQFIVPKETKQLLALGNKLPTLYWLYKNQSDSILEKIQTLNELFTNKSD